MTIIEASVAASSSRTPAETWAIIPARGGSKSIPDKNIRLLAGKPLIVHTITAALKSRLVTRVIVSTDSPRIAEIARAGGAEIVWRPAEIAGDAATSESALLHALTYLHAQGDRLPERLVFLQCTSPFTLAEDIDGTIASLEEAAADTALAVAPFHYFLWRQGGDGNAEGVNHDKSFRQRRQDREPQYVETGAVYVMRTSGFLQHGHRFFGRTAMHAIPPERVFEIDEPVDFELAEARFHLLRRQRQQQALPSSVAALVMDFDGVFTDNRVYVHQDGTETVACDRGDGMGIEMLRKAGLPMVVISKERNPVVQARCAKLGIACHHGVDAKLDLLASWLVERGILPEQAVYVGNDINDLECLRFVGCGAVPADAHPEAAAAADLILNAAGGRGALRELAELILATRTPARAEIAA